MDFLPDENIILFIEDLNEPVYKIDRMLTYLFNNNEFRKKVKGIAIGEFLNLEDKSMYEDLIFELGKELKIPAADGFKITHGKIKDTVPVGAKGLFNTQEGTITILEDYTE